LTENNLATETGNSTIPTVLQETQNFKQCPSCGEIWKTQQLFLNDVNLEIVGYQVNFINLELGYFLFNHAKCKTTLSLFAKSFSNLYGGPIFKERKTQSDECPEYCLKKSVLEPCPARCECAYVREIIQIIRRWEKESF
jgi:hypothetical protein